jgi:hypothetical protein
MARRERFVAIVRTDRRAGRRVDRDFDSTGLSVRGASNTVRTFVGLDGDVEPRLGG